MMDHTFSWESITYNYVSLWSRRAEHNTDSHVHCRYIPLVCLWVREHRTAQPDVPSPLGCSIFGRNDFSCCSSVLLLENLYLA